jgi:CubicO group peptidase (beta-lactamase class C family)
MTTTIHGTVAPGFDAVAAAFRSAFDGKPEMGAALAVHHRGKPVIDLWGGLADPRTGAVWSADTLSVIFSCTKGLVSILVARLVREGKLDYAARVADYWPEFAAAGKADIRLRDILAHRSGLSAPREPLTVEELTDWDVVVARLAAQEPLWTPGTGHAYHAITHGWLAGEVIRRVTGRTVGGYFADLIAAPLRAEAWIGLPSTELDRVAHLRIGQTLAEQAAQLAAARTPGVVDWSDRALTLGGALPVGLAGDHEGFNSRAIQSAEIPGAGGIATARALAQIWSATVVETDGVRLLDDDTLAVATAVQSQGKPVWDVPGPWPSWGMGFEVDSDARKFLTPGGFGHGGAGGQTTFADPRAEVGFAFLTNQLEGKGDQRAARIVDALRTALAARRPPPR